MSQKCVLDHCKRTSRAVCHCCNQDLCLPHFWQHNDVIVAQLNPLQREMDEVAARFQTLDTQKTLTTFQEQMKQWRIDGYAAIDRFFDRKCTEMTHYVNESAKKQRDEVDGLKKRVEQLIETEKGNQQDIDSITSSIKDLNDSMDQLQQKSSNVTLQPVVLDENLVSI